VMLLNLLSVTRTGQRIRIARRQRHQPRPSVSATRERQGPGAGRVLPGTQELETRGSGERWHARTTRRLLEAIGTIHSFSSPAGSMGTNSAICNGKES
jgi:hypothetical protein